MEYSLGGIYMSKPTDGYDVVIVGFGAAGASAAIEAADAGAKVLVLDRGYGGGASALSGGVVYAGGGTSIQKEAGVHDTPENMYNYLRQEVGDVVSNKTLRRFCETSPEMIEWLKKQGAEYRGTLCPYKTSYPTDAHYLYYSGNEKAWPYKLEAEPAARGHRTLAKGLSSGKVLFQKLSQSAFNKGVDFQPLSRVHELIIENDKVVGLRYRTANEQLNQKLKSLTAIGGKLGNWLPPVGKIFNNRAEKLWQKHAEEVELRAKAIVISAGGFIFNPEMKAKYAGGYIDVPSLGTVGDDGMGIKLGISAGGSTAHMERMTSWRFISPPSGLIEGITVDSNGGRIANEELYGATHSTIMIQKHNGRGYLILDSKIWNKSRKQISSQTLPFQRAIAYYLFSIGHKKANSMEKLARKIGVPTSQLAKTVEEYNQGIKSGKGDPGHKSADNCSPIEHGPYYAINISVKNSIAFPAPGLTLGGLRVNEETGQVLTDNNTSISGLYAAGRSAIGICSNGYISGLSLADCIFSGRRAGLSAAQASENIPAYA
jgi:3-oxo-5alpha-steroid 4-dehydrogenase